MEKVYRLFDRRCRTDTALAKLAKLRQRVRQFKKVGKGLSKPQSSRSDKALTFLDDKLLLSTSNAVERLFLQPRFDGGFAALGTAREYPGPSRKREREEESVAHPSGSDLGIL